MNIVLIIQARMGSTRLPGKSNMDLAGEPLLSRILERVKRSKKINQIVVATTKKIEDDIIEDLSNKHQVFCFRGSENNLVDRYFRAARKVSADLILRLPADNPCPQIDEFDKLVDYHLSSENDFSSNICNFMNNGYPDGIGVEIFSFEALEKIWFECEDRLRKEHLALNFYDYVNDKLPDNSNYKVGTIKCPENYSRPDIILEVNSLDEYIFMEELYENLYSKNSNFSIIDIIDRYDNTYKHI